MPRKHLEGDTFCHSSFSVKLDCLFSRVHREDNMLGSNKRQAFPATTTQKSSKEEREEEEKLWRSEAALEQLQQDQRHREFSFPLSLSAAVCFSLLSTPSPTIDWL